MKFNGIIIPDEDLAEKFASVFENKINDITATTSINDTVFNGTRKLNLLLQTVYLISYISCAQHLDVQTQIFTYYPCTHISHLQKYLCAG